MNKIISLKLCPVCGRKPYIFGSYPVYNIIGNENCPLCKKICYTAVSLDEAFFIWNSSIDLDN